jgi:hypothetical protein
MLGWPFVQSALIAGAVGLVYFLVFGARFAFRSFDVGPGGDTQNLWSVYWISTYSLWNFGEFLWWDPTSLNGWPAYYLNNHGWGTMLSPFQLAQQLFGWALHALFSLEITQFLILQKTLIVVLINIVGITLVSRELLTTTVARLFPPFVYALCQMQFLGYVAAATAEALSAAIFLLYGVIYYNNRRTPRGLLVLILFVGIYAASINYMTLTSHAYPLAFFATLLVLLFPGCLPSLRANGLLLVKHRLGAMTLVAGLAFALAGAAVFLVGVRSNLRNFARLIDASTPYDINRIGAWDGPTYGITSADAWTSLFYWIPYSDLHDFTMRFDPYGAGNDYRYIGLATLPLIIIALVSRWQVRYVACLILSFFLCLTFVALTHHNLPFSLLIENFGVFRNIRTMALVMPRDLLALFPILVAAVGLDAVALRVPLLAEAATRRLVDLVLIGLVVLGIVCLFVLVTSSEHADIRKSLGHIGIYLIVFSGILFAALHASDVRLPKALTAVLLVVVFVDLNASASDQWFNNNGNGRYYHGRGASAMKAEQSGVGPLVSEADSWPGTYYSGMIHNVHHGGPHFGHKYWLALVTRPKWQPVVENWNPASRMVTRYPYFNFFTNAAFISEVTIHSIDAVTPPATELPSRIVRGAKSIEIRIDGKAYPVVPAKGGVIEHAAQSQAWPDRHLISGVALDSATGKPARLILVFVGDELWYRGSPNRSRPGAFHFEMPRLPDEALRGAASVRVLAITQDDHALELTYPKDYPFASSGTKPAAAKPEPAPSNDRPTFYVHDPALVKPGVPARRLYDAKWELVDFTFNRVKVKVDLPEAAYMVFLDNYDRYWRATVNGERVQIQRANYAFKTVHLPAGSSVVEWVYNPLRVKLAWMVYYLFSAVALGLFCWWGRAQRATGASSTMRP